MHKFKIFYYTVEHWYIYIFFKNKNQEILKFIKSNFTLYRKSVSLLVIVNKLTFNLLLVEY